MKVTPKRYKVKASAQGSEQTKRYAAGLIVEAIQFSKELVVDPTNNAHILTEWLYSSSTNPNLIFATLINARRGDWIVKDGSIVMLMREDEFPEVFERAPDPAPAAPPQPLGTLDDTLASIAKKYANEEMKGEVVLRGWVAKAMRRAYEMGQSDKYLLAPHDAVTMFAGFCTSKGAPSVIVSMAQDFLINHDVNMDRESVHFPAETERELQAMTSALQAIQKASVNKP